MTSLVPVSPLCSAPDATGADCTSGICLPRGRSICGRSPATQQSRLWLTHPMWLGADLDELVSRATDLTTAMDHEKTAWKRCSPSYSGSNQHQCDSEWEHRAGITITTLDNPEGSCASGCAALRWNSCRSTRHTRDLCSGRRTAQVLCETLGLARGLAISFGDMHGQADGYNSAR
jgi:hypothetical protein